MDMMWKVDPISRGIKAVEVAQPGVADYKTDLLLRATLQRRALAFDMAGIMSYECHETLVTFLFDEYSRMPPEGCHKIIVDQLHSADREVFGKLAKLFGSRIRGAAIGGRASSRTASLAIDLPPGSPGPALRAPEGKYAAGSAFLVFCKAGHRYSPPMVQHYELH